MSRKQVGKKTGRRVKSQATTCRLTDGAMPWLPSHIAASLSNSANHAMQANTNLERPASSYASVIVPASTRPVAMWEYEALLPSARDWAILAALSGL